MIEEVKRFLVNNGLCKLTENLYGNDKCAVFIDEKVECYKIEFGDFTCFSQNLNIYWLIGFLTYENLIDRNYV